MSMIAGQVNRTSAFLNLYQELIEGDCKPLVRKGIVCRQLYGEYADHRPSGDEDIISFKVTKCHVKTLGHFPAACGVAPSVI